MGRIASKAKKLQVSKKLKNSKKLIFEWRKNKFVHLNYSKGLWWVSHSQGKTATTTPIEKLYFGSMTCSKQDTEKQWKENSKAEKCKLSNV